VWLIGEFGEMLVNGSCKNPDGQNIIVDDSEIIEIYEKILNNHNKKGERSDIIIMWSLTAISKLSIRIGSATPTNPENNSAKIQQRIKKNLKDYTNHVNVEIQQRACEFMHILDTKWDVERNGIFEPMPFKGDENMLVDAKDRMALDEDEGDNQLLMGFDTTTTNKAGTNEANGGGLMDMMMGGPTTTQSAAPVINNDMMDLFGGGPAVSTNPIATTAPSNDMMDLFGGPTTATPNPISDGLIGLDMGYNS
jgi:hypothetical protein